MDIKTLNYLNELNSKNNLRKLYDEILNFDSEYKIPAVKYDTAIFLNWITMLSAPENILEIGFGSGASSIFINYNNSSKIFISLERDKNRFIRGEKLLNIFSINNIELINEDAFKYFITNRYSYDLIFLDSVKREYIDYLEPLKKILNKNGILICDNILFNEKIVNDNIDGKYKNGINLLKKFNKNISTDNELNTVFLPIGDGLSVSIKK